MNLEITYGPSNNIIVEKSYYYSWANQCLGEENEFHDKNRRTSKFRFVGQNYASKFHSANLGEKFLEDMIQDLYDEVLVEKIPKQWFHIDIIFLYLCL